jgi:hypothetical protein
MFWFGSLMSQVLQCTQFCALMTKRGSPAPALVLAALVARTGPPAIELPSRIDPFIDAGRAVARRRPRIGAELRLLLQFHVAHLEVDRLIFLVIGVGQEHRGKPVEGQHAVRLGIVDGLVLGGRLRCRVVRLAVLHRAEEREPVSWFSHMSSPPSPTPSHVPKRDQSGFTLRTRFRSVPISLSRHSAS